MFTVLDRLSLPGSPERPYEDASGAAGAYAWVLDGATPPGATPAMDAPSDAAWLVAFADGRFRALAPRADDPRRMILQVIEEARALYLARLAERGERRERHLWPTAALTLARATKGCVETLTLADTIAYVRDAGGGTYTLGEAPALRAEESALAARLMRETGTACESVRATPAFAAEMEARRRALLDSAPAIFGLHADAAMLAEPGAVALDGEGRLLLATDGFSALSELYGEIDAPGLMDAALADGLAPLGARLRRIETERDPHGRRFPRFKRSDDATAILLAATF